MRSNKLLRAFTVVLGFLTLAIPLFAASPQFQVLSYLGQYQTDASSPNGLVLDAAGNLYGTSQQGGNQNLGAVFELSPGPDGTWTEKVLYSFCSLSVCADGATPMANLILDSAGNLYGTTIYGGTGTDCYNYSCGTVFELSPGAGGTWTETVLHSFIKDGKDGCFPTSTLIFDAAGNLYGTTEACGANLEGTVFKLTLGHNGQWKEKVLYSFQVNGKDGFNPEAGVIFDTAGNLYGTTINGGASDIGCGGAGCGAVFELAHKNGRWTEKVIYSFCPSGGPKCRDGEFPGQYSLAIDADGNLYGTTQQGGASGVTCGGNGCGTVYELIPGTNGKWKEKVLRSFQNGNDGWDPSSGVVFDKSGNVYGTTYWGGGDNFGAVFELTPGANGKWMEQVLHYFHSFGDGQNPAGGLILDGAGNLYGTDLEGPPSWYGNGGTVFEITP